ncbi:Signal recognition particle, subunit Srp9 [Phaffia rhodozyma]|uniref:Signal recognition particle, subunit Srp9 n=1 Tax=Phaffia rhodozyma TaxID=264483 RepID=A0A0F7SJB6_PHARH|nr:Signal recognition particle, subunit Srp9 [Phaffia rhodozyma]
MHSSFKTRDCTRYSIKFRAVDGVLVLKVTDDNKVISHKTRSSVLLNRFEQLNKTLMARMMNLPLAPPPSLSTSLPNFINPASTTTNLLSSSAAGLDSTHIPERAEGTEGAEKVTSAGAGSKKKKNKGKKK